MKEVADTELKSLAIDIFEGKVFTDRHCRTSSDISTVFMPIILGAFNEMTDEERKDIGMIYEYLSEAGPRSCNGMPMFTSFKYLIKADAIKVMEYYEKYQKFKEDFLKEQ
jgi:hypothetical protein